jgi:hypothetical protein
LEVIFRCFFFREDFRATRAISVLELFEGYAQPFLVIPKPCSANFDLLNLMEEVSEPFESIFTSKFSIED